MGLQDLTRIFPIKWGIDGYRFWLLYFSCGKWSACLLPWHVTIVTRRQINNMVTFVFLVAGGASSFKILRNKFDLVENWPDFKGPSAEGNLPPWKKHPENQWLADDFPFGTTYFQSRAVAQHGDFPKLHLEVYDLGPRWQACLVVKICSSKKTLEQSPVDIGVALCS